MTELLSKLKEKYNFKKEKDESWSFEYKGKKAFFLNLSDPINIKVITPFVMRRKQLTVAADILFDSIENKIVDNEKVLNFTKYSIEIIGNLLDKSKMGSVEYFINMIYKDVILQNAHFNLLNILGEIIHMIDHSTIDQLSKFSDAKTEAIHKAYFEIVQRGLLDDYIIDHNGVIQILTRVEKDPDPEDEYNLAKMKPINREEI